MTRAFIALGSNLGDRHAVLRAAIEALAGLGDIRGQSSVYETAPLGPPQPDYLNAVVEIETTLGPEALLAGLLAIEAAMGRVRRERWGPRLIDLDLLAFGDLELHTVVVDVPHPEIARRAFVLRPWLDIAPEFAVPGLATVRSLWESLPQAERMAVRPA